MWNFFTSKDKDKKKIHVLTETTASLRKRTFELGDHIESLKQEINRLNNPKAVRKALGIIPIPTIDFVNTSQDDHGFYVPKSYLPDDTESQEYIAKISELTNISKSKVLIDMLDYIVNFQGNFSIRHGDSHEKTLNGRFVIEGVEIIRTMLNSAADAYSKRIADINEQYDEHEVSVSAKSIAEDLLE